MKGNLQANETPRDSGISQQAKPCAGPGSYNELTPHEFNECKEMAVVLLKAPDAAAEFRGFAEVHALPCSQALEGLLRDWPCERPIGLVCPDGQCSSRAAIRLSRQGFQVHHLAGGLLEWHQCTLG